VANSVGKQGVAHQKGVARQFAQQFTQAGRAGKVEALPQLPRQAQETHLQEGSPAMAPCHQKAASSLLVRKEAATQTEVPRKHAALQISGCSVCHQLALETDNSKGNICIRCNQADYLLCLVAELREEVDRLRSIREAEQEIDRWSRALTTQECTQEQPVKKAWDQRALVTYPHQAEGSDAKENSEWKQVRNQGRRRTLSLPTTSP